MSAPLEARLAALAEAAELAEGRLDPEAVEPARAVVARAGERLGHGLEATVVALAGPTGAGKSTLFNVLAGRPLVKEGVTRPDDGDRHGGRLGRARSRACWTGSRSPRGTSSTAAGPDGLVVLDLPDFDSVEASHRIEVDRLVRVVDLLVWVVDPQKYADAALHDRYLRPLAGHAAAMLVVLNQSDRLGAAGAAARADLERLIAAAGLRRVAGARGVGPDRRRGATSCGRCSSSASRAARRRWPGSPPTSARPPAALGLARRARGSRPACGAGTATACSPRSAGAAGIPAVEAAALPPTGAAARSPPGCRGSRGCAACGPTRCAGCGSATRRARTSAPRCPRPTSVQRAQVDAAIRALAGDAARGLPDPWPALVRRAATAPRRARGPARPRGGGRASCG